MNKKINIALIALMAFSAGVVNAETNDDMVICSADAMVCPDGTSVGRTGPNCEFVCGGVTTGAVTSDIPAFTAEDKIRGWYYGDKKQMKPGTPEGWLVRNAGTRSAQWYNPGLTVEKPSFVPNTAVTTNIPAFTAEDKMRGWYYGDKNQKKPGTPEGWLVRNAGTRSAQWYYPGLTTKPIDTTNLPPKPAIGVPPIPQPGMTNGVVTSREEMEARAKALRASTTAANQKIKDAAQKKRIEVARKQTEIVNKRLEAAIERVQKLSERVSEKLDSLEKDGVDVSISRSHLAEVKIKLDDARTKVAAVKLAVEAIFANTEQKDTVKYVQTLVKDAATAIKDAHSSVAKAISSIKPGINKQVPASTTTSAPSAGTTTTQ